jgi:hypothetical protein
VLQKQVVLEWIIARKSMKTLAPQVGFEPTTLRLTAECSTVELLRSNALQISNITLSLQFDRNARVVRSGVYFLRHQPTRRLVVSWG